MAMIAALFDSEADATAAMDRLMDQNIHNLDTRVIDGGGMDAANFPDLIVPIVPNTGTGMNDTSRTGAGTGSPAALMGMRGWLDQIDDETERAFYYEGLREGASLALARVDDKDAERVRQLMRSYGARTYVKS